MPSWWDYLQFNRQYHNKRNLEEGLFQIASQTCNILVKVNNTNNINLTRNDRSDEYGCAGPPKGKSSMQICVPKFRKNSITSGCNPGLSFVTNDRTYRALQPITLRPCLPSKRCIGARVESSLLSLSIGYKPYTYCITVTVRTKRRGGASAVSKYLKSVGKAKICARCFDLR
ncbi:unnamed protein product [Euphydryas editha]|uniref:Uncharacterized protein n=1 Tax=Euphydryas editha TaxID=104508 RepID=A0AAU9TFR7_EUPED|nr:unnamed protein product [Euphydryas editha]